MSYLNTKVVSHAQRVKTLYKEACRNLLAHYQFRHLYRYHAVLLRARFDENKNIEDPAEAKVLLEDGERELFLKAHPQPMKFTNSPGGVAYGREQKPPDWMVDMWHPLERAQYPEYFARRNQRKIEYIERWEKKYGKDAAAEH